MCICIYTRLYCGIQLLGRFNAFRVPRKVKEIRSSLEDGSFKVNVEFFSHDDSQKNSKLPIKSFMTKKSDVCLTKIGIFGSQV